MAFSICNATRLAGHTIRPARLLQLWTERGICIPGSLPVTNPHRALEVARPLLKAAGLTVALTDQWSATEFARTFPHEPVTQAREAYVISLGPAYMRKYHDSIGPRTPKRAQRKTYEGPCHDVLVLGMEADRLLVHDPDPQLLEEKRDERFNGLPVVELDSAQAKTYFSTGDHARTLTTIAKELKEPEQKRGSREPGQRPLLEDP